MPEEGNRRRLPQNNPDRIKSLENDLRNLRTRVSESAEERSALEDRLKEANSRAEAKENDAKKVNEQIEAALASLNGLVDDGIIPKRIQRKTIPSFVENLAAYMRTMSERLEEANQNLREAGEHSAALEATNKQQSEQLAVAEETLKTALEQTEALRQQINARIAEYEEQVTALQNDLEQANETIEILENDNETVSGLVDANRELADELEQLQKDFSLIADTAKEAKAEVETAKTEAANTVRTELQSNIAKLQQQNETLQAQINTANKQLQKDGKTPYLPAERVAGMLNDLVDKMQTNLGGVNVSQGEFKLKLAIAGDDETPGFVIPTTDASAEIRENLQEITFRFDSPKPSDILRRKFDG